MGEGPDLGEMEPRVGVEPTTCRLRIGCSTTELPRPLIIKDLLPYQTYFRPTAIKLPSNCHQTAITRIRNRRCVVRLSLGFPQRDRNDRVTFSRWRLSRFAVRAHLSFR